MVEPHSMAGVGRVALCAALFSIPAVGPRSHISRQLAVRPSPYMQSGRSVFRGQHEAREDTRREGQTRSTRCHSAAHRFGIAARYAYNSSAKTLRQHSPQQCASATGAEPTAGAALPAAPPVTAAAPACQGKLAIAPDIWSAPAGATLSENFREPSPSISAWRRASGDIAAHRDAHARRARAHARTA